MNFFAQQRESRRRTFCFVALFIILIILVEVLTISLCTYLFNWWTDFVYNSLDADPMQTERLSLRWLTLLGVSLGVLLIILVSTLLRSLALVSGGPAVAAQLGGKPLPTFAADPQHAAEAQRLRNIVEEMAVASGTPPPQVYWLPKETAINAFVAGYTPADAVLAVTRGALEQLNRDEMQGVVAHEFSHLLNGDMRLNTQVVSWLFGLYSIYAFGRHLSNTDNAEATDKTIDFWLIVFALFMIVAVCAYFSANVASFFFGTFLLIAVASGLVMIIGIFGLLILSVGAFGFFSGRLLQAAISRQREYLADASAVQFTRQTRGLAGALKKVYYSTSHLTTKRADCFNHFFLCEGIGMELFATHPPLLRRIQKLDKYFVPRSSPGKFTEASPETQPRPAQAALTALLADEAAISMESQTAHESQELQKDKPGAFDSVAYLLAQLINPCDYVAVPRGHALIVDQGWGQALADKVMQTAHDLMQVPIYERLTCTRLVLARLHELSFAQRQRLRQTLKELITVDQRVSLLEVAVALMARQYLESIEHPGRTTIAGHLSAAACRAEVVMLKVFVEQNPQHPQDIILDHLGDGHTPVNAVQFGKVLKRLNHLSSADKLSLMQYLSSSLPTPTPDQQEVLALIAACLHTQAH